MAETPITITVEQVARTTANARLRERLALAMTMAEKADLFRGQGKHELAQEFEIIATDLSGGQQIRLAPISEIGPTQGHTSPFGVNVTDRNGDAQELPDVQFNSDEDDAMRALRAQGGFIARSNALRD